ncbi:MAG: AzlC family ABC transporter permease [Spirochaetales bacterium]
MKTHIFRTTLPVAFGYLPLGMAFGVLLQAQGWAWWWASLMGLVIYAGSGQFLAVGLLASGAGLLDAFLATFLLNLRHVFYGLTLLDRYRALGRLRQGYATFALTDETFSLLAGIGPHPQDDRRFVLGVTALNQAWWVLGCTLGAVLGQTWALPTKGLEFALTALFAVLLVEQLRRRWEPLPLAIAVGAAMVCLAFLPGKVFLLASISISCVGLLSLPDPEVAHPEVPR